MQTVVPYAVGGGVQYMRDPLRGRLLFRRRLGERGEDFGEEVSVVAPAGFEQELARRGTLRGCISWGSCSSRIFRVECAVCMALAYLVTHLELMQRLYSFST